ncbi:unnamed protein product [Calypogeia fissa]
MAKVATSFVLETAPPLVITVNRRSNALNRLDTIVEENLFGFMLETAPPLLITVNRRSSSLKRLDTIVEESLFGLLEVEVTDSFSSMGLNHWSSPGNGKSFNQRRYVICTQ